jgi:hypothetical protein
MRKADAASAASHGSGIEEKIILEAEIDELVMLHSMLKRVLTRILTIV